MRSSVGCWCVGVLLCAQIAVAQKQVAKLENPVAMTSHRKTGHVFLVEQGKDQLIRWDGEKVDPLFESLSTSDVKLVSVVGITFRDGNRLSLLGYADKDQATARIATLKVEVDKPAEIDSAMSSDLLIGDSIEIDAVASTDLAIYFSTTMSPPPSEDGDETAASKFKLWQLPTGKATLGKPRVMQTLDGKAEALAISPFGHVVAAVRGKAKASTLEFFHAGNGRRLLAVPTELESITSLAYGPGSKLLYATGLKANQAGVYRMDVFFDGSKQSTRAAEIAVIERANAITISQPRGVVMVGGETDGRLATIDVE